jgi:hypothetical protein
MDKKEILYRTSDLYFGAYLCSLDIPLMTSEKEHEGDFSKVVFVFKIPQEDLARLKASYFGGSGTIRARKFVDSLRSLKSLCHT